MKRETKSISYKGEIIDCPVTYHSDMELMPESYHVYEMNRLDDNGKRKKFAVIDFCDQKGTFVDCYPIFDKYLVSCIKRILEGVEPEPTWYKESRLLRYVDFQIPDDVYCLYTYADVIKGEIKIDSVYKPRVKNGSYVQTNIIRCLQNVVPNGSKSESLNELFHLYFDYAYDTIMGQRRKMYEEDRSYCESFTSLKDKTLHLKDSFYINENELLEDVDPPISKMNYTDDELAEILGPEDFLEYTFVTNPRGSKERRNYRKSYRCGSAQMTWHIDGGYAKTVLVREYWCEPNETLDSAQGLIYSEDMKVLIRSLDAFRETYVIAPGTIEIKENVFFFVCDVEGGKVNGLKNITLPNSLEVVPQNIFDSCACLEHIYIDPFWIEKFRKLLPKYEDKFYSVFDGVCINRFGCSSILEI